MRAFAALGLCCWLLGVICGLRWAPVQDSKPTSAYDWHTAWTLGFESGATRSGKACSDEMKRLRRLGAIGRER